MRLLSSAIQEGEPIPQRFTGARTRLLPPENATGNLVKVVQRLRLNDGEDREHLSRVGMSVEPKVWLR